MISLAPEGGAPSRRGWRLARSISSNRYHYYPGIGTHCLCGRWKESELVKDHEERRPIPHIDGKDCVAAYEKENA